MQAGAANGAEYRTGPAPAWVAPALLQAGRVPTDQVSSGAYWRIVDRQVRLGERYREAYYAYAIELLNEAGVEANAQLTIEFDPTYQSLTVHDVSATRDGRRIDLLPRARASVLQRESDLESRLYDGTKTLSLVLEDVREGDLLHYSYSISGYNPVFGWRFYDAFTMQWATPVEYSRLRVLHPQSMRLYSRSHAAELEPRVGVVDGERELLWERKGLEALIDEGDRPSWHWLYPFVQLSATNAWSEVDRWAVELYGAHQPSQRDLLARAKLTQAIELPSRERLLAALRFVQREIRYTGIEVGAGSHQPTDPATVLQRRFGDCKDKSLLLIHLLRALDVQADPALVDSDDGVQVERLLPSPLAFDHVIVRARIDGEDYWLDPTLSTQQGPLERLYQPDYGFALVVTGQTSSLQRMPLGSSDRRTQEVADVFDLRAGIDKPGQLTVTTTYEERQADIMRARLASSSRAKVEKDYANFYARSYSIEPIGGVEVKDEPQANTLRTVERYRLKTSFKNADDGGHELTVSGYALDDYLTRPDTTQRRTPLAVRHPVHVRHSIELRLPERWDIEEESGEIKDPAFHFRFRRSYDAKEDILRLQYDYRSLADNVAPAAVEAYLANLERVGEEYGYWLGYDPDGESGYVPAFYAVMLFGLAAGIWLAWVLYRYSPPPIGLADPGAPSGISGWLILPALGNILGPFAAGFVVWSLTLHFDPDAWAAAPTTTLTAWARPIAHFYLVSCLALSVILACLTVVVLVLFFQKRTSVPRAYPALTWGFVLLSTLIVAGMKTDDPVAADVFGLARDVASGAIWTAYFLVSQRVRATFTNPGPAVAVTTPPVAAVAPEGSPA